MGVSPSKQQTPPPHEFHLTELERIAESNPSDPSSWYNLGMEHLRRYCFEEAESALEKALNLEPETIEYWVSLGTCLIKQIRFQEAEIVLKQAMKNQPDSLKVLNKIYHLYKSQQMEKEASQVAMTSFRLKAQNLSPDGKVVFEEMMKHYLSGDFVHGHLTLLKLEEIHPGFALDYNKSWKLPDSTMNGAVENALRLQTLQSQAEKNPYSAKIWFEFSEFLQMMGHEHDAQWAKKRAEKLDNKSL